MSAINLKIEQLLLDSSNPRIGSASNQRDALQKILDDQGNKLAELTESIVSDGMSPIERLLVLREKRGGDRFISLEGNRRVAALKILSNPAVLASLSLGGALQKRFERLAKDFDWTTVEPIACYEVAENNEAIKWIYLRHTGENEGRGVVGWSGLAAARFRGTDPALQTLEFVKEHGNLDEYHKSLLDNAFPITTLDRLLSTREVRELIGVEVKEGKLRSGLHGDELMKPLRRMVLDLAEKKINVSGLKNRIAQVEYVKCFGGEDKPDLSKIGPIREVKDFKSGEFKVKPAPLLSPKRRGYDPSQRKTLVPRNLKLNISIAKIAEIYKELRTLWMEDNPHSCAVLLRVFLELSVDYYMKTNKLDSQFKAPGGKMMDKKLNKKVEEVIEDLVNKKGCKRKDFAGVSRALSDRGSPLHIDLLHAYLHSLFQTPKTRDLRSAWDEAQPFFERIWA